MQCLGAGLMPARGSSGLRRCWRYAAPVVFQVSPPLRLSSSRCSVTVNLLSSCLHSACIQFRACGGAPETPGTPAQEPAAAEWPSHSAEKGPPLLDMDELHAFLKHPQRVTLEILLAKGTAAMRYGEFSVSVPLANLRQRLRAWGCEKNNCHRPLLLFGDDKAEVQRSLAILREEGFTSVHNAQTREVVAAALRRPPPARQAKGTGGAERVAAAIAAARR